MKTKKIKRITMKVTGKYYQPEHNYSKVMSDIKSTMTNNINTLDKPKRKQHKHFWLPLCGYKNPDNVIDYSGGWRVNEVYCAYCLKTKEL